VVVVGGRLEAVLAGAVAAGVEVDGARQRQLGADLGRLGQLQTHARLREHRRVVARPASVTSSVTSSLRGIGDVVVAVRVTSSSEPASNIIEHLCR